MRGVGVTLHEHIRKHGLTLVMRDNPRFTVTDSVAIHWAHVILTGSYESNDITLSDAKLACQAYNKSHPAEVLKYGGAMISREAKQHEAQKRRREW